MKRISLTLALLVAIAAGTPALAQQTLPIGAFFGSWTGGGVSENEDSIFFRSTVRDFDVTIRPAGTGFRIDWTTVIRKGGNPDKPDIRRRKSSKTLMPTGTPGVFHGTDSGDPLSGKEVCWARLDKNTLSLFLMTVDSDGIYTLQQYDRTLSGAGMQLTFKSLSDGDRQREVIGRLVKSGK
tara:strand:+ start:1136 stop:1678 length:543 start_codon:yes stop_codon:yes gene_type:complete